MMNKENLAEFLKLLNDGEEYFSIDSYVRRWADSIFNGEVLPERANSIILLEAIKLFEKDILLGEKQFDHIVKQRRWDKTIEVLKSRGVL